MQEKKTTQLVSLNETTQLGNMNETTQQEKTTQLASRERNNSTLHCRRPPAPPLQQNRLFLPSGIVLCIIHRVTLLSDFIER
ncbi:hypothetical protein TNCV_3415341 [Trichonephila clavipes]|nr:hypothetical protein TNCV_3415341 [Trichonephila clavipes]